MPFLFLFQFLTNSRRLVQCEAVVIGSVHIISIAYFKELLYLFFMHLKKCTFERIYLHVFCCFILIYKIYAVSKERIEKFWKENILSDKIFRCKMFFYAFFICTIVEKQ